MYKIQRLSVIYEVQLLGCHQSKGFDWITISKHDWWLPAIWILFNATGTCRIRKINPVEEG